MNPSATVYLITNTANGKTYVGVTRFTLKKRWGEHVWASSVANAKSHLHRAIAKYGRSSFTMEALASCLSPSSPSEVERAIIKQRAPIYNQTNGGEITRGKSLSREVVARIAAKNRGRKRTPEQIAANSAQAKARWQRDPKYRHLALEAAARGRANIDQEKRKLAAALATRGRKWSDESRAKLSASCMGRRYSPDIIARMSASKLKAVVCTTVGRTFRSVEEAARFLGVSKHSIYKICAGSRQTVKGFAFSYVE